MLQTTIPEQLSYSNGILTLTVLGGVKLEGLDRLRVTLKAALTDSPRPPIRHNLDLYNDTQVEKLTRKIAERLETGTSVVSASLSELTTELEAYRLEQIQQQQHQEHTTQPLTAIEKQTAIQHLQHPNLMQQTITDLQHTGIQGEQTNSMILYMAMTSRKCPDPLSVICLAKSGIGKSFLMEKVADCIPAADKKEHTQFTGNAFYYYKRAEIREKVFLIEDLDGAQEVMFPIRELQTKKRISKTVTMKDKSGQLRTMTLVVEGPVSVIGCTTKEQVYEDNANRSLLIYLDSTREQDSRVMDYQKQLRAGIIDHSKEQAIQQKLQQMQQALEPVKIINPYAPMIDLPQELFKPRRTLPLLLSFIEAITYYHQYQREPKAIADTAEMYIETSPQDIEWGFALLQETLFRKSDELSGGLRSFLEQLRIITATHQLQNLPAGQAGFKAADIRKQLRIAPRTLQYYLKELAAYGYLHIAGGKQRSGYEYEMSEASSQQQLQTQIDKQVLAIMERINNAHEQRQQQPKQRSRKQATVINQG